MDGGIGNNESERMGIEGEDSEATDKGIEDDEYESIGINVDRPFHQLLLPPLKFQPSPRTNTS
jgi:hypothetical protein